MSEDNQPNRYIYAVNDTKKEIFVFSINSKCEENDSDEIKSMDPEERLLLRTIEVSFHKFKQNNWNYNTDNIKRVINTQFNLAEYQTNGYVLK